MQLVAPAKALRKRLPPAKVDPHASYRLLKYTIASSASQRVSSIKDGLPPSQPHDDRTRILNLVTGEALELDGGQASLLNDLPAPYRPEMDELIEKRFLVPLDFDDKSWVDLLRGIGRQSMLPSIPSVAVMVTSLCNARCPYCYEQGCEQATMTPDTARHSADYIAKLCAGADGKQRNANITWYGGEPLIATSVIDLICDRLKDNGVTWNSFILTNAYLVDGEVATRMRGKWNVTQALVTLDGDKDAYNRTKAFPSDSNGAYDRVMRNIGILLSAEISIHLRLNLGLGNYDSLVRLIPILAQEFGGAEGLSVHVSLLDGSCGNRKNAYTSEQLASLYRQRVSLIQCIKDCGMASSSGLKPLRLFGCMADSPRGVMVNPYGGLAKCYRHAFDDVRGSVFDEPAVMPAPLEKMVSIPECEDCVLYPDCLRNTCCVAGCREESVEGRKAQIIADLARLERS